MIIYIITRFASALYLIVVLMILNFENCAAQFDAVEGTELSILVGGIPL